jgi:pseudouridine-5'-phosphate glycosidase
MDQELGRSYYAVVSAEAPGAKEILKVLSTYEILNSFGFQ